MSERFIRDTSAPFNLEVLQGLDPPAGTNFSVKLDETYTYELITITFQMECSVAAANRHVTLQIHMGTDEITYLTTPAVQTASETLRYAFGHNLTQADLTPAIPRMITQLPTELPLPGGAIVSSVVNLLDAADQLSLIRLYVKRWPILEG